MLKTLGQRIPDGDEPCGHLDELLASRELLPRQDIVFSHFSARYTAQDVALPDDLQELVRVLPAL